jgi:FAD:protein FMN transferase
MKLALQRLILGSGLAALAAQAGEPATLHLRGLTMGTTWSVQVARPPDGLDERALRRRIQSRLDELEARLSTYRDDSEVTRFNRATTTNWFPVSRDAVVIVTEAQRISALTDGAFDITAGPLVELWGFGRNRHARIPSDEAIRRACERVGWRRLHAQLDPLALRKDRPDLAIDLSGIAKGYAVDEITALLQAQQLTNSLVQVGGETRTTGYSNADVAWRVGIEPPGGAEPHILRVVTLTGRALATSGDARNLRMVSGRRLGHILDPRTGQPVTNHVASVSVMADSCMTADALATGLLVLGTVRGLGLAGRDGLAALFVIREGDALKLRASPAWEACQE